MIISDSYPGTFSLLDSAASFSVSGTLELGPESQYNGSADIENTGLIAVSAGGTLLASGNEPTELANSGTIAASSGVIDITTAIANTGMITAALGGSATTMTIGGAVTGAGTLAISGAGTMALGGTVAAGQVVQLGAGTETLALTNAAASAGFSGTLDGFAKGDSVVLSGENISSARFSGASIIATISTGGSIVLATGTQLQGSLSVIENSGNATLTYASGEPSLRDWSAGTAMGNESHAALAPHEFGGVLPRWEGSALDMILSHRPWH